MLGHDPVQLGVPLLQDLALLAERRRVRLRDLEPLRVVLLLWICIVLVYVVGFVKLNQNEI